MLSSFDHTALQISRTKTYSSLLGKVIGIIIFISLALTFTYKIIGVLNKQTIFLNSYYANDRSAVNFSNFQFFLAISDWGQEINYNNQFQYGLNVTMQQRIWNNTDSIHNFQIPLNNLSFFSSIFYKSQTNSSYQQYMHQLKTIKNKGKQSNKLKNSLNIREFQMVSCQNKKSNFCVPPYFASNLTLQGDHKLQDKIIIQYTILIRPCDSSHPSCKSPSPDGYVSFFAYKCQRFDIYQRNTQNIFSPCPLPTARLDWIADQQNLIQYATYKLQQINITTYQPSFIPSFIPKFIFSSFKDNKIFQQSWFYDNQQSISSNKRKTDRDPYLAIDFQRSRKSQSYQRRFLTIDSVLAQIFGISAFIAIIIKLCIGHYTRWQADCYIAAEVSKDYRLYGSFSKYIKQKLNYCFKSKESFYLTKQRNKILKKANQNVDIIQLSYKITEFQQKIKHLQQIIANFNMQNSSNNLQIEKQSQKQMEQQQQQDYNKNMETQKNEKYKNNNLNQSLTQNLIKE